MGDGTGMLEVPPRDLQEVPGHEDGTQQRQENRLKIVLWGAEMLCKCRSTEDCFRLRSDPHGEGSCQDRCPGQPEPGLPGPGGHIATNPSLSRNASHGWHVPTSVLRSYTQEKN